MTRKQHFLQHWIICWLFRTFVLCKCKQLPCHETERRVNMNWENYSWQNFLSPKSRVSLARNSSLFGTAFADWLMWPTNRSYFHSCVLSFLAFKWKWGWRWPRFDRNLLVLLILMMLFWCWWTGIYIIKAARFLSKQGHLQPHFHTKARGPFLESPATFRVTKISLYLQQEHISCFETLQLFCLFFYLEHIKRAGFHGKLIIVLRITFRAR